MDPDPEKSAIGIITPVVPTMSASAPDLKVLNKEKEKSNISSPTSTVTVQVNSGGITPPPPYTEKDEQLVATNSSRKRSSTGSATARTKAESNTVSATGYTIPKDLKKEGLPNPVFSYSANNSDDDEGGNNDPKKSASPSANNKNNHANANNGKSCDATTIQLQNTPSFTSLSSYENNYASQTALYTNNNVDYDAEKGPNSGSSSESKDKKKGKKNAEKEYKGMKRYLGMLLTLSASFSFSVVVLFVKILKDYGFDAYGASFWRYTGTVIPTIPLLFYYEWGPGEKKTDSIFSSVWPVFKNENWKTWVGLLSRGLIGSTSVILRYYALQYLSIGDTSVITYSTPVLVTVLAHFFLGEKCGVFPIIIAFVTLCGVVVVTKPPILTGSSEFDSNTLIGTGYAVGSLFCSALIVIITRKIRAVHFTVMTLVFGFIGVGQALLLIYFLGQFNLPQHLYESLLVGGVASLSFLGQMAIVLALKFEQAGPVALIRSCDVLFGFLFQYLFLNVIPDIFSAIGAVVVLTGVLSTGFRKWLNTLPGDDHRRKRWWFILK